MKHGSNHIFKCYLSSAEIKIVQDYNGASKCWLLGNIMGHLPVYHQLAVKLMVILELEGGGEEISC